MKMMNMTSTMTMTSLEVVAVINSYRDEDVVKLPHNDFLKKVRKLKDELSLGNISESTYQNSRNQKQPMLLLDKEACLILVASETPKVLQAIIKRWQELEHATQVIADALEMEKEAMLKDLKLDATIEATKATIEISKAKGEAAKARGETAKLKLQALKEKLAEQSRVLRAKTTELLTQGAKVKGDMTASKLGLPVDTITNLLKAHGSKLKPGEANNALINLGYLEPSRAEVTVRGSYYGRTIVSSKSAHTTLARWFPAEFGTLLKEIDQYYADKASGLD